MQSTTKTFIEIDHIDESLFVDDDYVYDESKLPPMFQSQDLSQLENQINTATVDTSDLDAAWADGYYDETKRSPMFQSQEWGTAYDNDNFIPTTNSLLQSYMLDEEDESVEDISFDEKAAREELFWENYEPYYWDEWSDEEDYYSNDEKENGDNEQI
jgi:hypothetical protein